MQACKTWDATDRCQTCLISNPGVRAARIAGKTKRKSRVIELKQRRQVLPIPWKMLEVVKTIPAATKLSETIREIIAAEIDHVRIVGKGVNQRRRREVRDQRENQHHQRSRYRSRSKPDWRMRSAAASAEVLSDHRSDGETQRHDRQEKRLHHARARHRIQPGRLVQTDE